MGSSPGNRQSRKAWCSADRAGLSRQPARSPTCSPRSTSPPRSAIGSAAASSWLRCGR